MRWPHCSEGCNTVNPIMAAAGLLLPLLRLADRKNKGPFDATLATPPERAAASRRRGPQQGGARCSVTVAGAGQAAQDGGGERRKGSNVVFVQPLSSRSPTRNCGICAHMISGHQLN